MLKHEEWSGPSRTATPNKPSSKDNEPWPSSSAELSARKDTPPAINDDHGHQTRLYSDEKIVVGTNDYDEAAFLMSRCLLTPDYSSPSPSPSRFGSSPMSSQHFRSDSDTSLDSTGLEVVANNELSSEEVPDEPFFSPIFQTALHTSQTIAAETASAIERLVENPHINKSDDLDRLLSDAISLSGDQTTSLRTIAVIGDSGEGKSSVINSLLDFPELAKTGDLGEACTSVVTEYRQKTQEQHDLITIEVEYLSEQEIIHHIEELVWSYRNLFVADQAREEGSLRDDRGSRNLSDKDYERIERESEHAWSALDAAFGHHDGFRAEMLTENSQDVSSVVAQLVQWSQELEWPQGDVPGRWETTAANADECCEKTSIFMHDKFWPFTKIIRVFIDAPVLRTGVVLADLPGLQDTNLARVRLTQTYLLKSDHVFLVTNIMRAKTNASLRSSLYQALAQHIPLEWEESAGQSLRIAVVCTKTDDINMRTNRLEFCGQNKPIPATEWSRLEKELAKAKAWNNDRLAKCWKRKQKALLMDARNRHVTAGLQAAYASRVPGGTLDVFCVSSKLYSKFKSSDDHDLLQMSGIPELRRFCHSITASARLIQAQNFLRSKLPSLLTSMELWVTTEPALDTTYDAATIRSACQEMTEQTDTEITKAVENLEDEFDENLFQFFERRNEAWEREAESKGSSWSSWHWTQYNAWVLNRGDHYTAKRGHVNWNAELIWKCRMELDFQWNLLIDDCIPEVFDKLFEEIQGRITKLKESQALELMHMFVQSLDHRVTDIQYGLNRAQQRLTRELRFIRRNASEPNGAAYILAEMLPAYRSAATQRGTGMSARQRSIVQGRITNVLEETFERLRSKVANILRLIRADLNIALPDQASQVQLNARERESRDELAQKVQKLQQEHRKMLASIAHLG